MSWCNAFAKCGDYWHHWDPYVIIAGGVIFLTLIAVSALIVGRDS